MDYKEIDAAMERRLRLHVDRICPVHLTPLLPVALGEHVYGCEPCKETWHLPPTAKKD